ncbi:cysteine-rich receptor-like protein kinase 6 isoform X4 [Lolium rigidum]|uniref:cysteine-rich receptor-like protein kinase 6 isoform X4 n=1 Tax=Lolium rigidum TaxID=89674 RepID=UPI001F5C9696|nr:cysteine-rich receptor-like protein kinase 6 isoform X4 [Lolium rigidum]
MAGTHRRFILVSLAVVLLLPRATAYPWQVCGKTANFTANSTYQANLDVLAAALPKNISSSPDLFATAVVGSALDQVSALALCRGDANATTCSSCLAMAFQEAQNLCAYDKDAAIYYDPCALYYSSNVSFLSSSVDSVTSTTSRINYQNVTSDHARFNRQVAALVNATADYAAYNSTRRYAAGEADLGAGEFPRVYSWAQCTPDLTPAQCRGCLADIVAKFPRLFTDRIGGRTLGVRCSYRYEINPFLNSPVMVRLAAPPSSEAPAPAVVPTGSNSAAAAGRGEKFIVTGTVLVIVLPTIAALLVINLLVWLCIWRKMRRNQVGAIQPHSINSAEPENIETVESMLIDISTLRAATGGFTESNKLGEGGFGSVYKGTLPDGYQIAVKRLSKSSTQGIGELMNELALVAKLQHKNLVRLVGVCLEQDERLLVYEFVPNRSLDQILFDAEKREQLDWGKRYKIINGIARGLQYLHEDSQLKVIHRDLKASNVLLDTNMNPKISDFGLAKLFGSDQTQGVTSRVVGTYGYMAPEYALRGNYSVKSDVFSFGVMVLEIVTGKKNNDSYLSQQSEDLLTLVWEHWTAGSICELIDPGMGDTFSRSDALRCIHIGLLCAQGDPAGRPVMSSVIMMLGSDTVSLQAPPKPVFYARQNGGRSSGT